MAYLYGIRVRSATIQSTTDERLSGKVSFIYTAAEMRYSIEIFKQIPVIHLLVHKYDVYFLSFVQTTVQKKKTLIVFCSFLDTFIYFIHFIYTRCTRGYMGTYMYISTHTYLHTYIIFNNILHVCLSKTALI